MALWAEECRKREDGSRLFGVLTKPPLILAVTLLLGCLGPAAAFGGEKRPVVRSPSSRIRSLMTRVGLGHLAHRGSPTTRTNRYMDMARRMLADAHRLAQSGDLERAIQLATRADKLAKISDQRTSISWFENEEQPDEFLAQLETLQIPRPAVTQPDHICLLASSRQTRNVANADTKNSAKKPTGPESRHLELVPVAASQSEPLSRHGSPTDSSQHADEETPVASPTNSGSHVLNQADVASAADSADTLKGSISEDDASASDDSPTGDFTLTSATSPSNSAPFRFSVTPAVMEQAGRTDKGTSRGHHPSASELKAGDLRDDVALADPVVEPNRLVVQYQPSSGKESTSWSMTVFVQFVSTLAGLLFGMLLYVLVRFCILRRYGADIGVILGFDSLDHRPVKVPKGSGAGREMPPSGVLPFPLLASGSTYAEKREAERKAFQQKEAAILKYVFEKNLELRDQIVQRVGSVV